MSFASVDFEASYSKDRDIRSLGTVPYLRHPETDIYLVSFCFPDGTTWAGDPKDAPWDRAVGCEWVSHNRTFDISVFRELQRRGMPLKEPAVWHCSSDLMAYLQAPPALDRACAQMLGTVVSKKTRSDMKGVDYRKLSAREQREVQEYARSDALLCWLLWRNHSHEWPEHERLLSRHTTEMSLRGIHLDLPAASRAADALRWVKWDAENNIPWAGHEKITSARQIALACRAAGIPPPITTDAKDDRFDQWEDQYADKAPFVAAVQQWRRAHRLLKAVETMQSRCVDGRLRYDLRYFGAPHTGRWTSGGIEDDSTSGGGLNMQNFPREPFTPKQLEKEPVKAPSEIEAVLRAGIDTRGFLLPAPGHALITSDSGQIEARVSLWLAGEERLLDHVRSGLDLYEAHARTTMGYGGEEPLAAYCARAKSNLRQFAKCRVLGLGFQMGAAKFQRTVKQWAGIDISLQEAKAQVSDFRSKNRGIAKAWENLSRTVLNYDGSPLGPRSSCLALPGGRMIRYFDLSEEKSEEGRYSQWTCRVVRGGPRRHIYGGKVFQNGTQGTARDFLGGKVYAVESSGIPVVLHVHDEIVAEVPLDQAEEAAHHIDDEMSRTPDWAEGLPVKASTEIRDRYGK